MVTVAAPGTAEALAVRVSVLVVVVGFGAKAASTPVGRLDAARLTLPLNPFCPVTVIVLVTPKPAGTTVRLLGEAPSVKLGTGAVTCSAKVCVLAAGAPEVFAESVTVVFPTGVVPVAVTVKVTVTGVDEVGLTVAEGEKAHAAPVGSPVGQLSATEPANEPEAETTNVLEFEVEPCTTLRVFGLGAVSAKSTTWSVIAASCVVVPASVPTAWALKL